MALQKFWIIRPTDIICVRARDAHHAAKRYDTSLKNVIKVGSIRTPIRPRQKNTA